MMIVKAEVLWTRKCPLNCHYCAMNTKLGNSKSIKFWKQGLETLKKLQCSFIAIYGAEPLFDFDKLPEFVHHANEIGIDSTLITAGVAPKTKEKIAQLYDVGLRSLTTSYDVVSLDKWSSTKPRNALKLLDYFRSLGSVDNVAVVITLTRKNYTQLYRTATEMTQRGIWTFFDIIHPDRGQPGSKCRGRDEELMFKEEDLPRLQDELARLLTAKDKLMIHASSHFLNKLILEPHLILNYSWNCAKSDVFPSWVTVDCDGQVYPCDDFQPPEIGVSLIELYDKWDEVSKMWKQVVLQQCPGCVWNTHIDAHYIKKGLLDISSYVHK